MAFSEMFEFSANYLTLTPLFFAEVVQTIQEKSQYVFWDFVIPEIVFGKTIPFWEFRFSKLKLWEF